MFPIVATNLHTSIVKTGHSARVWHWKELQEMLGPSHMHGLCSEHHFKFFHHNGIYVCWKQWMTDEQGSQPKLHPCTHACSRCRLPLFCHFKFWGCCKHKYIYIHTHI